MRGGCLQATPALMVLVFLYRLFPTKPVFEMLIRNYQASSPSSWSHKPAASPWSKLCVPKLLASIPWLLM